MLPHRSLAVSKSCWNVMTAEKSGPVINGKPEDGRDPEGSSSSLDNREYNERGQWNNKIEFVLSVAGEIIGLGNVWRFPYLCYKNGGGAFFVPYVIFFVCCGIPVFFLETALGQFTSEGGITCWRKVCPLFEGIGYATQVIEAHLNVYYVVILAWAIFYLFNCFTTELPWAGCGHYWNTENCVDFYGENATNITNPNPNATSPVIEFWERRVLKISDGIEHMGGMRWELAMCLALAWFICYFCIWKGPKSTGKTCILSELLFYTVHGNSRSIEDCIMLCCLNSGTSFVAGFAIFSVLGFMAYEQNVPIEAVAESGPGLAFIAYPKAVTMMPLSPLWACLFFMMLIFLGLDSQFVCVESLVTAVVDMYPETFRRGYRRELLILGMSVISFFIGLIMCTEGGMYVFQLFDSYAASGMCLLFVAIFESICIGWVYGSDRFYTNIEDMIGYKPVFFIKWCWMILTPGICAGIFLFFLIKYKPLKYNNVYTYPDWGYGIGWFMAMSSMVCIPLGIIWMIWKTPGTFSERMKKLTTPSPDLKMRGKLAALSPYAANDAKLKIDGKISTISEKETHF
ncbi:hypothetical protein PAMP_017585 [Pampus punctatissimus]